jgi:DNA-binding XRE family transcriptional regulator
MARILQGIGPCGSIPPTDFPASRGVRVPPGLRYVRHLSSQATRLVNCLWSRTLWAGCLPAVTRQADLAIAREIGRRIAAARKEAGLTQEALAERAQLHPVSISTIETASRAPSVPVLLRLAAALGVDPADLVRGMRP